MLYATHYPDATVVAAADTVEEFNAFVIRSEDGGCGRPGLIEMLTEDRYKGFKEPPVVIPHVSEAEGTAFVQAHGLILLKSQALRDRQRRMLTRPEDDPTNPASTDERTIAEIAGIAEHDPWDRRTAEEKERDAAVEKAMDEARKSGNLTGESFAPLKDKPAEAEGSSVHVTQVNLTQRADGGIEIESSVARQFGTPASDPAALPDDERMEIAHDGRIVVFHKVAVEQAKLADIEAVLATAGTDLPRIAVDRRNCAAGCWAAVPTQQMAEDIAAALGAHGLVTEVYAVNKEGGRIVPRGSGAKVVEAEAEVLPLRPWHDPDGRWPAMDEAARAETLKSVAGREFVMAGWYGGPSRGTELVIAPRSLFAATGEPWKESLPIKALLPRDLEEIKPGHYRTLSRDWNGLSLDLNGRGFRESLKLQLWWNNQ